MWVIGGGSLGKSRLMDTAVRRGMYLSVDYMNRSIVCVLCAYGENVKWRKGTLYILSIVVSGLKLFRSWGHVKLIFYCIQLYF